jgi:hypothetical protein
MTSIWVRQRSNASGVTRRAPFQTVGEQTALIEFLLYSIANRIVRAQFRRWKWLRVR